MDAGAHRSLPRAACSSSMWMNHMLNLIRQSYYRVRCKDNPSRTRQFEDLGRKAKCFVGIACDQGAWSWKTFVRVRRPVHSGRGRQCWFARPYLALLSHHVSDFIPSCNKIAPLVMASGTTSSSRSIKARRARHTASSKVWASGECGSWVRKYFAMMRRLRSISSRGTGLRLSPSSVSIFACISRPAGASGPKGISNGDKSSDVTASLRPSCRMHVRACHRRAHRAAGNSGMRVTCRRAGRS
jgi:hypothetical protein